MKGDHLDRDSWKVDEAPRKTSSQIAVCDMKAFEDPIFYILTLQILRLKPIKYVPIYCSLGGRYGRTITIIRGNQQLSNVI